MQLPKKDFRAAFLQSPDWDKCLRNMSALYLLLTYINNLAEDTNKTLEKYGLAIGYMKHEMKKLLKDFDEYEKTYRQYMEEGMMDMVWEDWNKLSEWLDSSFDDVAVFLKEFYFPLRQSLDKFIKQ